MDIQKQIESRHRSDQNKAALFILIFIVTVGFPLWWKTTDIPRATLPYEQVSNLPDLELVEFKYKLFLVNNDNTITSQESADLSNELLQTWKSGDANVTLEIIQTTSIPVVARSNELVLVIEQCSLLRPSITNSTINICWGIQTKLLLLDFISNYSQSLQSFYFTRYCLYPPAAGIQISFTYILPYELGSHILPLFYSDIDQFYSQVSQPLRELINFTMDSQIYHFSVIPGFILQTVDEYYISEANISQVVNRIESYLNSYTLQKLKLNYLVYTPSLDNRPLGIRETYTGEYHNIALVDDWGTIILTGNDKDSNYSTILPPVIHNLKQLLKFPYIFFATDEVDLTEFYVFNQLEVNPWLYKQIQCYHNSAKNNLNSLIISISAEKNMFINTDIQLATLNALEQLEQCRHAYIQGELPSAYLHCKEGWEQSYKANYDPSILSLLYFPEDQKYAIYVPLFLPLGVILLRSAVVFIVGGGNYTEYQNLRDYCKRNQSSKQIIYGMTDLVNPENFLKELIELGESRPIPSN
ncbi:GPI transamidase component PIG-S-like [Oopsacas minuta]|uniref:GPI transamidase component PIG-S-like n=1 Tax=Oopsacas minuta TaxID=111878 RepID=A0AAV7K8P4_9METZ|nr:GPI transamidase component PIG-S-like [Oopsacas minuta]